LFETGLAMKERNTQKRDSRGRGPGLRCKDRILFPLAGVLMFCSWLPLCAAYEPADEPITPAQRQWLSEHPHLRIGLTSIPPQVFYGSDGQLKGLCVDYIAVVEDRLQYQFDKVYFDSWDDLMRAAFDGRVDVIYAAQKTPKREEKFQFTRPYLEFENMIVTSKDVRGQTLHDLVGKKVAVVRGNSIEEDLAREHPDIQLVPAADELGGLLLVAFKEADAMVIEPSRASYLIEEKKITNLHLAGSSGMYFRLGFAVRKDMPELTAILDAGLAALSEAQKTAIQGKWIPLSPPVDLWLLWWGLGGCGTVALLAIVWSMLLRRQVERRTIELRDELQRRTDAEHHGREMEEQFRHVIEFCPLGVLLYRLENGDRLVLTAGNTGAEKVLGIELRSCFGRTIEDIFPGLAHTDIPDRYRKICKTGIPWEAHLFNYHDHRIKGTYELYAFQTSAGQLAVMFSDISDHIAARQAVEQSEALLGSIFRAAPVGIGFVVDRIFKHVNNRLCSMLGYTSDELLGHSSRVIYPTQEEYEQVGSEKYAQIRKTGIGTVQTRWQRKDGVILDILLSSAAIDVQDLSKGATFTALDITDQIAAQRSLAESQRMLTTLIGNLPGVAYRCENKPDRPMQFISKGCRELTGYTDPQFMEKTVIWKDLIAAEHQRSVWEEIQNAMARRENYQLEYRIRTADGQDKWVWEQGCGIFDPAGNVVALEGFITDITARKEIKQSLLFFQFAIEHSGEAAYWVGPDANFVYVNEAACRQLGYSRKELLTMSVWGIDVGFPKERWADYWRELKEKKSTIVESRHRSKDGQEFPVEISGHFVAFEGREYNCSVVRDVREQKQAREQLRLNAERTEAMLKLNRMTNASLSQFTDFALEEAVRLTKSKIGYLAFVNEEQTVLTMHSWSRSAMAECAMSDKPRHYPVESTGLWGEAVRQRKPVITNDYSAPNPLKKGCPEGHVHLRRHMNVPVIINSKIVLVAGVGNKEEDYTEADVGQTTLLMEGMWHLVEQRAFAHELANSEQRFREMFQRMSSAVAVYQAVDEGDDFVFADFNPAAERTEKIKKDAVIGRRVTEVFPGIKDFGILDVFRLVWKTGQSVHYPLKLYRDERVVGWRDNYIYRLAGGEIVALYDDVSDRILAEQAREKLMKELQAKNEELEGIVFVASHDLRSPLVNIQGFAGELQKSCRELTVLLGRENLSEASGKAVRRILDEDIPESLSFISAGTGKMDVLAKGLLRLARIGTVQMHIEDIDMNRLMATILKTVQYQMREYDVDIQIDLLPSCLGDWVQLNQAFSNLIDNAIKYRHPTRKARIEIQGVRQDNRVRYTVRDNGIGIAPEHGKRIFEIFHRLNPAGPVKGEGLGLTIVQRILDRLDGKIHVESSPDAGAAFIVDLPAAEA
jgi:PAS domain S-box-containing protein